MEKSNRRLPPLGSPRVDTKDELQRLEQHRAGGVCACSQNYSGADTRKGMLAHLVIESFPIVISPLWQVICQNPTERCGVHLKLNQAALWEASLPCTAS